jgi:hypothetical protein
VRDWWIRTLLVLQRPRPVFVALRDDSRASLGDRAEPVLAIVILGGIAWALSTGTAAHLMDDSDYDAVTVAIWAFIVGGVYGMFGYFALGAILHRAVRVLGSQGTYRRTRHVLAFAAVPLVVSLAAWPVKLALFGGDAFRSGGEDAGADGTAFVVVEAVFLAWALGLLVVGVRAVHGWTWARAAGAVALAAAGAATIVAAIEIAARGWPTS